MNQKKLNRAHIAKALVAQIGVSGLEATRLTELIINEIIQGVISEKKFKASGFGSFVIKKQAKRTGRNIKTGEAVDIPAKTSLIFKSSVSLDNRMTKAYLKTNPNR